MREFEGYKNIQMELGFHRNQILYFRSFTFPLLAHMFLPFHLLHQPAFQFALSLPVMVIGLNHFGKSAWGSMKSGHMNMDVLITLGSFTTYFIH